MLNEDVMSTSLPRWLQYAKKKKKTMDEVQRQRRQKCTVHICPLHRNTDASQLAQFLGFFGRICDMLVVRKDSYAFALVEFNDSLSVHNALQLNGGTVYAGATSNKF